MHVKYNAKKPLNTMQIQKAMDGTLKADGALRYEIEQHGERKKLIGIGKNFRSFAYFTQNIEPAKQAIRTEWLYSLVKAVLIIILPCIAQANCAT